MKFLQRNILLIVIVFCAVIAIQPLFHSGFFPMHDDTQVQRVYEMGQSLRSGMFPVRWVSDLGYGYGYPLFNFYAPFAYYIGGFLLIVGFNALVATKIMIGAGIVLAGITMFYFAKAVWGEKAGFISGLLYMFAPYHALDVYVRGDIAEMWAYAFTPLVFLGIWLCFKKKTMQGIIVGAIGYALVILSHNLTAMMITPFIIATMVIVSAVAYKKKSLFVLKHCSILLGIGILLSCFYWLPVFSEMKYTNVLSQVGGGADYKDHFVCLTQLWNSPWGYGGSAKGCEDGLSFRIGKIHVVFAVIGVLLLLFLRKKQKESFWIGIVGFIFLILSTLFLLPASKPIWDAIHTMAFFQYPWRFLLLVSFFSSVLAGGGIVFLAQYIPRKNFLYGVLGICALGTLFLYGKLFTPQTYLQKTASDYTNEKYLKWDTSKISDEYMPKSFKKPKSEKGIVTKKVVILSGNPRLTDYNERVQRITLGLLSQAPVQLLIKTAYFPTWAFDNRQNYTITNSGYLVTIPPASDFRLSFSYHETGIEQLANLLSICGIVLLVLAIISLRKNEQKTAKAS